MWLLKPLSLVCCFERSFASLPKSTRSANCSQHFLMATPPRHRAAQDDDNGSSEASEGKFETRVYQGRTYQRFSLENHISLEPVDEVSFGAESVLVLEGG